MILHLSSLARADLRAIATRARQDNGAAVASRVTARLTTAMHQLERFPELGRPGREPGTRELPVPSLPFVVVCRPVPDVIAVDRILHGAMQWPRPTNP